MASSEKTEANTSYSFGRVTSFLTVSWASWVAMEVLMVMTGEKCPLIFVNWFIPQMKTGIIFCV